jgi:hypothetical protein
LTDLIENYDETQMASSRKEENKITSKSRKDEGRGKHNT